MVSRPKRTRFKSRLERNADAIGALRDANGRINPTTVWQAAQSPDHPMHGEFTWDEHAAAVERWEQRARELIREVKFIVSYEDRVIAAPYYVSDPSTDESAYIETKRIMRRPNSTKKVLQEELERIRAAIARARALAIVFNMEARFDNMLRELAEVEAGLHHEDDGGDSDGARPSV